MRFQHDGISLWLEGPAERHSDSLAAGEDLVITIGVEPADASNRVELRYRINGHSPERIEAEPMRHTGKAQFFKATLPASAIRAGDTVEYTAICRCVSRQVPSEAELAQFGASFRVIDGNTSAVGRPPAPPKAGAASSSPDGEAYAATARVLARPLGAANSLSTKTVLASPYIPAAGGRSVNRDRTVIPVAPLPPVNSKPRSGNTQQNQIPEQYVITGSIIPPEGFDHAGIRVQAFDRDLPSLERRGSVPQMLGEAIADEKGGFRITYTREQFSPRHISFRAFDRIGQELNIKRIEAPKREFRSDEIIFNAPTCLEEVSIFVDALRESGASEYEQLIALIAPVLKDLPLIELSDEDVVFLMNELDFEQPALGMATSGHREVQQNIEWLRRCALLAQETNLPVESFYGWGRKDVPTALAELAAVPLNNLPKILETLTRLPDEKLRGALLAAIAENITPIGCRTRMDEIVRQLKRRGHLVIWLRMRQRDDSRLGSRIQRATASLKASPLPSILIKQRLMTLSRSASDVLQLRYSLWERCSRVGTLTSTADY